MLRHSFLFTFAFLFLFTFTFLPGQSKEQVKTQAESALQTMTPEQVDAKIKEAGMTRTEAEAKAKSLGIDLNQYLRAQASQTPAGAAPLQVSPQGQEQLPEQKKQVTPANVPQSPLALPGFEGRTGLAGLTPFGYNIFNFPATTFEPVTNAPTPPGYILGPGDEVILTMWGETQLYQSLVINREGQITIPNIGPVPAQSLTIDKLKEKLLRRLTTVYSGIKNGGPDANTWVELSIGRLRSLQVFVLGEVKKPGGYSISSMSTSFLGLYVAGGPTYSGTLRDLQILRENKVVSTVDFYDFILKGDKSKDVRLQDGDVIFVKPAGKRAAIAGNVLRPAIYELKKSETLGDLIKIAGGLQFIAYYDRVHIERVIPFSERKNYSKNILDIDLKFGSMDELLKSTVALEDGDIVSILRVNEFLQNRVTINGNVKKPGVFSLTKGMTVRDLVKQADGLLSDVFGDRAHLIRVLPSLRREIIPFSITKAMEGIAPDNSELEPEDEVIIYNQKHFFPEKTVTITGAVKNGGTFTRVEKMTVADLVALAGGFTEESEKQEIIISRVDTLSTAVYSKTFHYTLPPDYLKADHPEGFLLEDFDYVFIPYNPRFTRTKLVSVRGEVVYPGNYALENEEERIAHLVERAGGVKPTAYLKGSRLIRAEGGAGLVPIEFSEIMDDTSSRYNIRAEEGDEIIIDKDPRVVYVRGEVGVPSAVVYEKGASLKTYLKQAGGLKDDADEDRIFVTLPNGRKWESRWCFLPDPDILAGSTVFVPMKIEREDKTWQYIGNIATTLASLAAITVAIVQITK
jgi:protein involved in polysaccharide export with SLBB domain